MIIRNERSILEQLSEIEGLIQKVESMMDENGIEIDREKLLLKILRNREAVMTSRNKEKN